MTEVSAPSSEPTGAPADESTQASSRRLAWGYGLASTTEAGVVLDTWYPNPQLGAAPEHAGPYSVPADLASLEGTDPHREIRQTIVCTAIDLDVEPAGTADAYLRLHLLSHRLVRPNDVNLTGIFGVLPNVVWTNHGPCPADDF